jgi:CysZ protein
MIAALFKALNQMPDPAFRQTIGRTLLFSLLLFAGLLFGAWWLLSETQLFSWGWLEAIVDVLGWFAGLIAAFVLFPGAALVIISFMLEPVARAVEAKHYPDLGPPRHQPAAETVLIALRYAAITVFLNLVLLWVYFIPVLNVFVFAALNGYLLGREYFELIAPRRLEPAEVRPMWKRCRGRLWIAGMIITLLLSIPFINWIMPVAAAAFMLHMFEKLRRQGAAA